MDGSPDDLLSFKEFPPVHGQTSPPTAQININSPTRTTFGRQDPLHDLINDMSQSVRVLEGENFSEQPANNQPAPKASPLTIEFYQKFFNVDTMMVIERMVNSVIPNRAPNDYLKNAIGKNPDLYGPFWICVTLIFSIAISGNIADYLQSANLKYEWKYNFHLVSHAASAIYMYACVTPLVLWLTFKWSLKPNEDNLDADTASYTPSILSLMCIYGYSFAIYIPVSILWVIQYSILQWILVITAACLSGIVIIIILRPALKNSRLSFFLLIGIIILHLLLAAGFMLYFFYAPSSSASDKILNVTENPLKLAASGSGILTNHTT